MKSSVGIIGLIFILGACHHAAKEQDSNVSKVPIQGTWKLVSGTMIAKTDTTFTDYTHDQEMIKIINGDHFAFLKHDLKKGKDSAAVYDSGGGSYTLTDDQYTEHLEYCNEREWEDHQFKFKVSVQNDTLVQQGLEKIEGTSIDRIIIEKYARVK